MRPIKQEHALSVHPQIHGANPLAAAACRDLRHGEFGLFDGAATAMLAVLL
jgi:hypothetical protein